LTIAPAVHKAKKTSLDKQRAAKKKTQDPLCEKK